MRTALSTLFACLVFTLGCGDDAVPTSDAGSTDGVAAEASVTEQGVDIVRPDLRADLVPDLPVVDAAADASETDGDGGDGPDEDGSQTDGTSADARGDAPSTDATADATADAMTSDSAPDDLPSTADAPCVRQCSGKECGGDGCGDSCGTCAYGCENNLCRRKLVVISIVLPCENCGDLAPTAKPDPKIKVTLANGESFESGVKKESCNTLTYNWSLLNLSVSPLKNAKIEVWDQDPLDPDDLCARWTGDFSEVVNRRTLTAATYRNAKLTYTVSK